MPVLMYTTLAHSGIVRSDLNLRLGRAISIRCLFFPSSCVIVSSLGRPSRYLAIATRAKASCAKLKKRRTGQLVRALISHAHRGSARLDAAVGTISTNALQYVYTAVVFTAKLRRRTAGFETLQGMRRRRMPAERVPCAVGLFAVLGIRDNFS